ncbi:MAG: D-glycero-D-manno-heptose 1-phosphate guanosyltransferase, partial [Pseudopedobacter saltans]
MDVIILAGGKGTRLQSVISDVPKPMAPINGKPFLYYILSSIKGYNISKIILSIGFKGEIIKNYFGEDFLGIPIEYAEELEPLGTGGGIQFASQFTQDENFIVMNGDTWFPISLLELWDFHLTKQSMISIALKE